MKQFFSFFIALIALASCTTEQNETANSKPSKFDTKSIPSDMMFFQRSFPDDILPVAEMDKTVKKLRLHEEVKMSSNSNLPWTLEGPTNIGGRLNCIAIHPENEDIIFTGASAGGVFKTENGGDTWVPIADDFSYLPIAFIAIDQNFPDTMYVATGDPALSGLPHVGDGIYRTYDGGSTWQNIGLTDQRVCMKIEIDPVDNNILYAATMGLPFERNDDRGLYKSTDYGDTWEQIHYINDESGFNNIIVSWDDPQTLYTTSYTRIRNNTESLITSDQVGIFRSSDAGNTWEELTEGLPTDTICKINLEMSQNDPLKLWALYVGTDFSVQQIYRTIDGGDTWGEVLTDPEDLAGILGGFGWYFGKIRVNPFNEMHMCVLGVDLWVTYDGGITWDLGTPEWWWYSVHADKHELLFLDENSAILATDGGLYRTDDGMDEWEDIESLPNTQFYRVAIDHWNDNTFFGGAQDNGTSAGNSTIIDEWPRIYGGDGFQALSDYEDSEVYYYETQNGNIVVSIDGDIGPFNEGINQTERTNWDSPIIMSSHTSEVMYTGTMRVYRNEHAPFDEWEPISDDLTDGLIYASNFHTITTVGESRVDENILYAGTTDGNVHRTLDLGENWTNITDGLPERYVTNVKTSPTDAMTVYVTHSGYKDNDNTPHIHKSTDAGDTWIDITGDLPEMPVNHIEVFNDSIFTIATDFGVYHTENEGENWVRVGSNMPMIPVYDIEYDFDANKLIAGTFARSMQSYTLDSLIQVEPDTVDISVPELSNQISAYPIPCQKDLTFENIQNNTQLTIYDSNGRVIFNERLAGSKEQINTSNFKSGQYIAVLTSESETQVVRFLKQ